MPHTLKHFNIFKDLNESDKYTEFNSGDIFDKQLPEGKN